MTKTSQANSVRLQDIEDAKHRTARSLYCTPCTGIFSPFFERAQQKVFLKLETLHQTGSFKERGALNKLLLLKQQSENTKVIGASAGNHAQAVAYHGAMLGFDVSMIMPKHTPNTKVMRTEKWGAHIQLEGDTVDECIRIAKEKAQMEGMEFVHAFDDVDIIAGQGTFGLEVLEQVQDVDIVVVPIGGGGFISGTAVAIKNKKPSCKVIGVQVDRYPSIFEQFHGQSSTKTHYDPTIADGIAVKGIGQHTVELIEHYVDDIVLVSDDEIAQTILHLLEQNKLLAEGAGAAGFAAIMHNKIPQSEGKTMVTPICGGNIDMNLLSRIIERGYMKERKLIRLNVVISDRPGSLNKLTGVLAKLGANILQIHHQRASTEVPFYNTGTDLTLETRGETHAQEILDALLHETYKVTLKN
ncbi:MAG: threonine ammonia-lyase [Bdellovibrionota bacterium]